MEVGPGNGECTGTEVGGGICRLFCHCIRPVPAPHWADGGEEHCPKKTKEDKYERYEYPSEDFGHR